MSEKRTIDIERFCRWAYHDQRAEETIEQWEEWEPRLLGSFNSDAMMANYTVLGVRISGGGLSAYRNFDLHPDAELLHDRVMGLGRDASILIRVCAKADLRPDWRPGAEPRWEPCTTWQRTNGEQMPMYEYDAGYRGGKQPWFCPLRLVDGLESIAYHRRVYATWYGGLVSLATALAANREDLIRHSVTGPAAPAAPWNAQASAVSQIGIDNLAENR